ncbi:MAG: DUF6677 family protein [Acidobacteriota bacterium]
MNKTVLTVLACVLAWVVPGAGHFFLRRWVRGTVFFVSVVSLFLIGLALDGKLFGAEFTDLFSVLKFVDNAAIGIFYFAGRTMDKGIGDLTSLSYEYGNTFLYTAGLLNMLLILDAFDIAQGRKQ